MLSSFAITYMQKCRIGNAQISGFVIEFCEAQIYLQTVLEILFSGYPAFQEVRPWGVACSGADVTQELRAGTGRWW